MLPAIANILLKIASHPCLSHGFQPLISRPHTMPPLPHKLRAPFAHDGVSADPESLVKAAAWLWYLHGKGNGKEGGYVYQTKNRERTQSRFKSEAVTKSLAPESFPPDLDEDVWECDSNLYDSFELLSFSDRLNRSLTEHPTISAPTACAAAAPPPSLPRDLIGQSAKSPVYFPVSPQFSSSSGQSFGSFDAENDENGMSKQEQSKWSMGGFMKSLKKVATSTIRKRTRHRSNSHELDRYPQQQLSPYNHHQLHHHSIYNYLQRCYKAGDDFLASIEVTGKITASNKS